MYGMSVTTYIPNFLPLIYYLKKGPPMSLSATVELNDVGLKPDFFNEQNTNQHFRYYVVHRK
jgi:hypothetical protein